MARLTVPLDAAGILTLANGARLFVQDCFTKEAAALAGIAGGSIGTLDDVNQVFA